MVPARLGDMLPDLEPSGSHPEDGGLTLVSVAFYYGRGPLYLIVQ